jgi:hypothetical protein
MAQEFSIDLGSVVKEARSACFSMEIALHPAMPTYNGGLGIWIHAETDPLPHAILGVSGIS